jgi:hypothetical protein
MHSTAILCMSTGHLGPFAFVQNLDCRLPAAIRGGAKEHAPVELSCPHFSAIPAAVSSGTRCTYRLGLQLFIFGIRSNIRSFTLADYTNILVHFRQAA